MRLVDWEHFMDEVDYWKDDVPKDDPDRAERIAALVCPGEFGPTAHQVELVKQALERVEV